MRRLVTVALAIAVAASTTLIGCSKGEDPVEVEKRTKSMQEHWGAKKGNVKSGAKGNVEPK
jgi:hypothetical protein